MQYRLLYSKSYIAFYRTTSIRYVTCYIADSIHMLYIFAIYHAKYYDISHGRYYVKTKNQ